MLIAHGLDEHSVFVLFIVYLNHKAGSKLSDSEFTAYSSNPPPSQHGDAGSVFPKVVAAAPQGAVNILYGG